MTVTWNAETTEQLPISISLMVDGLFTDLSAYQVRIALPPHGQPPTVWFTGTWSIDTSTVPPTYIGRILVGPDAGVVTVAPGSVYDIHWSVTIPPETVVKFFDLLLVEQ